MKYIGKFRSVRILLSTISVFVHVSCSGKSCLTPESFGYYSTSV